MLAHNIINYLIKINEFKNYLEIGVFKGYTIEKIRIDRKDGVDPGLEGHMSEFVNYQMTSDDFFKKIPNDFKYDIIFIDGLHYSSQVDKDIKNSLIHLNKNGIIVLHDCNPINEEMQLIPRQTTFWTGDVWRSVVKIRCSDPNLEIRVVDTDYGVGIIRRGRQKIYDKDPVETCLSWDYFEKNKKELLNLISVDQFTFTKW